MIINSEETYGPLGITEDADGKQSLIAKGSASCTKGYPYVITPDYTGYRARTTASSTATSNWVFVGVARNDVASETRGMFQIGGYNDDVYFGASASANLDYNAVLSSGSVAFAAAATASIHGDSYAFGISTENSTSTTWHRVFLLGRRVADVTPG